MTTKKRKPGKYTGQFPLLVKRAKEFGFDIPTGQPMDDNVTVWRLPPIELSEGGLFLPQREQSPNIKGVLIAAGPRAMDTLVSNGCTLGHIVVFARFAGWETKDSTQDRTLGNEILRLKLRDILESEDLRDALESGATRYIKGEDGRHRLEVKQLGGRTEKLLALAADPGATPAERETAKRLAQGGN